MRSLQFIKLPARLWSGYLAIGIQSYSMSALFFLSLYLTTQLHYSIPQAGISISIFGAGAFLGSICSPLLTRWLGEKRTALILLIAMGVIFFFLAHLQVLLYINIAVLIYGTLSYAFIPANQVWILQQVPDEKRIHANNVWRVSKNILVSIGFIVNGLLSQINYQTMFTITAIVLFIGSAIIFLDHRTPPINNLIRNLIPPVHEPHLRHVTKPYRCPYLYAIYFSVFLIGLIYSQLNSNYPLYLHDVYAINAKGYGFLFAINTWLVIILQIPLVHWLSHYNHTRITALGALFMGLGLTILTLGHSWYLAILSCVIWSLGEILFFSLSEVMVLNYARRHAKVLFMSLFQFIYAIGAIIGPFGGGIIFHYYSGTLLWYVCGILGIIAFGICLTLESREKR